ncbi:MAG: Zn-ribbon domain-containing OB-fold protein [Burkholderiales bacterium]|nr:Zn-ribbon domain-containing OB-fold protein [Burkholderiales bacterium]
MSLLSESLPFHPEVQEFWNALPQGRFLLRACRACGRAHWYPRAICPHCASSDTEWREASGRGTIYTYSIMRRVSEPFAIAYVTLAEGPTIMTNIVESALEEIAIGKAVAFVVGGRKNGEYLPLFKLV